MWVRVCVCVVHNRNRWMAGWPCVCVNLGRGAAAAAASVVSSFPLVQRKTTVSCCVVLCWPTIGSSARSSKQPRCTTNWLTDCKGGSHSNWRPIVLVWCVFKLAMFHLFSDLCASSVYLVYALFFDWYWIKISFVWRPVRFQNSVWGFLNFLGII